MPPPEKLKRKLLTQDGDGWTDRGNTICPFHHSSNGGGIKEIYSKMKEFVPGEGGGHYFFLEQTLFQKETLKAVFT